MGTRPYVNNVVKTPFRSTKKLSSLAILHIHGRKDVDVGHVITWGNMPPYLRMTVCEYQERKNPGIRKAFEVNMNSNKTMS